MTDKRVQDARMQELYSMYDDIIFKLALNELQERELESIQAVEMSESEAAQMNAFFQETEASTVKFINNESNRLRFRNFARHTLPRVGVVIAVSVSILTAGLVTAVATVPVVRARVIEFMQKLEDRYSELRVVSNTLIALDVPNEWSGEYYPVYIPIGYSVVNVSSWGNQLIFQNSSGESIKFYEQGDDYIMRIDSEDSQIDAEIINGIECTLYEKNNNKTLTWTMDDKRFVIIGNIPREEIMKIAESVRILQ